MGDITFGRATIMDLGSKEDYDCYIKLIKYHLLSSIAETICKSDDESDRRMLQKRVIPELQEDLQKLINKKWSYYAKLRIAQQ